MSNIMDYIEWRGDIPFEFLGLNEIDNLVLATLSYIPFENIVPGPGKGELPLSAAASLYAKEFPKWESAGSSFVDMAPKLLMKCASSRRFEGLLLSRYVSELTSEIQFSALTFTLPGVFTYVAFRGTDDSIIGWKEDFYLSLGVVPAQKAAAAYLDDLFQEPSLLDGPLFVGGHSKGGNLSEYAAASLGEAASQKIQTVFNNDGPGFDPAFLNSPGYQRIASKILLLVPSYAIVGELLSHGATHQIVQSTQKTVLAHDPFTWQLVGPRFQKLSCLDRSAQFINQALADWIDGMTSENRKLFIDDLFAVLEAPGLTFVSDLYTSGYGVLTPMMQRLSKVDPKSQKVILKLLRILVENAGEMATQTLNRYFPSLQF